MKIITVRPPWAEAIIFAGKDVENRTRNLAGSYRGPLAIHSSKRLATLDEMTAFRSAHPAAHRKLGELTRAGHPSTLGKILGVVELVDVHHGPEYGGGCHKLNSPLPVTPTYGLCSPWGEAGAHHLVLANPRPLAEPIPFVGSLAMRELDADMVARIEAAIA